MRTWIMVQERVWVILLIALSSLFSPITFAQNVPGCDALGTLPVADFRLTYDLVTNRYTAWYVPTSSTPNRLTSGQFTIVTTNGFTTPGGNGRDAPFQITNINGAWADQVFDNEFIASVGATPLSTLNGFTVHQVGKAVFGDDVDPDGPTGPLDSNSPTTAGVPVPLFSFPGKGCVSLVRILVNGEPIQQQMFSVFGNNFNNQLSYTVSRNAGSTTANRYCKNAPENSINVILPDIQDDLQTVCATSTSYSNNYFTQVFRNWDPAGLPAGTSVVPTNAQQWSGFTVSPSSLSANVSINPTTGAYTVSFPQVGGVTQPGSLTICNTLRDSCNTATDQACVIVSWLSSGQVSITNTPTVCLSNGSAVVSLSATDGFSSYNWIGPGLAASTGNPVTATLSAAGVYSYTVVATSGQSCTASNTTSVTVLNAATIASITPANPTSCLGTDGSVTLNGLTAGQNYSIVYTQNGANPVTQPLTANGSGQIVVSGLSAGVYSFTVSNDVCTSTLSTTLTDPNPPVAPTITVSPSLTICLGSSLTLTAEGMAGASFTWTGTNLSQTTSNPVTVSPATSGAFVYTVTQTVGGCTSAPTNVTVTVNPAPSVTPTASSATACVGSSFVLAATASGGTPNYIYTWTGPNYSTTTTVNSATVSNATVANAGSYSIIITDANGCSATAVTPVSVSVINCCSLTATASASQTVVCAGTSVTLAALTSGAIGALSYQWTPNVTPGNSQSVVVTPVGTATYTVVVTDSGAPNCVQTATVTLTVNPSPVVTITPLSATICAGNSIQLTANVTTGTVPPYSYVWSGPNFSASTTGNTVSIPNATAANNGNYTVTITDQNSCTATATTPIAVTVTPLPTFTLVPSNPTSCSGTNGSVTITGLTSGQLYTISYNQNGGTSVSMTQTAAGGQIVIGSLSSGVYSVTVSQNGCAAVPQSITLTDPNPPIPPVITVLPSSAICLGNSVTLSANGTNLQWTGMNLLPITGSPVTATPGTSGSFVYTVTQTVGGCISLPASVTILVNPAPSIANLSAPPTCVGQSLSLSATVSGGTQPLTVNWRTPDGLTLTGNPLNRANAQMSMAGTYTAIVSGGSGCTATQTVSTTVGENPTVQVQPQQACAGGNVTLTATGGAVNYLWIGPNGFTATGQVVTLTGVDATDAGSYTVTVMGGNACTGTAVGSVIVNPAPIVKADFVSASVCVGSTVHLLGDVTTGTVPPYSYSWSGPNGFAATIQNPSILSAQVSNSGSYTFAVTEANGCSATATTPVSVTVADCCPPRLVQISITAQDPACGSSTGSATATLLPASPGGATVTYRWENATTNTVVGTSAILSGVAAGVYSVTITETSGNCVQSFTSTVSISETPGPDVDLASVSGANCGAANGSAQLIIAGGTTPYSISWTGPSSGSTTSSASPVQITGLMAGNYIFTVTGVGSTCRGIQAVTVPLLPTSLSLTEAVSQPVTCGTSGTVVVSWNSVGGPYQLTVDGVATSVSDTTQTLILGAGTHSIQIASGNPLCVSDSRVVIINPVPAPAVAGWAIEQQPLCAGQSGVVTFAGGQSVTTQYTISFLGGGLVGTTAGNIARSYTLGAGVYEITRIEPNGCLSSQIFEIIAPATVNFNFQTTPGTCGQGGSLMVTNITGGTPGFSIAYSGPVSGTMTEGSGVTGLPNGVYTVTVTDSRGCSTSRSVAITVSPSLNVIAAISSATACVGGSFVLTVNVTPTGSYTYTWSGPNNFTASGAVVTVGPAALTHSGSYTVVVTSAEGCSTTQVTATSITVAVCQPPCTLGLNLVSTSAHCNQADGQATVTASGGSGNYIYHWSTGGLTPTIAGLVSGIYSVTVTDAANSTCFSTTTVAVGNEGGPQLSLLSSTPATCAGATGAASVTATGGNPGYAYQWSNGSLTNTISAVMAGVYSVTVTDQNGCKDVMLIAISSTPGTLTAITSGTPAACAQATGSATVTASGGSGPYTYRWSTGGVTNSVNGLVTGVYSVTVTDANQCFVITSVSIDDTSGPQFTINKTNVNCSGGSNGTASVNITSGMAPFTYLWNTGAISNSISGLSAGTYSVIVTDANGCKTSDQVIITQPTPIIAELSPSTIACGSTVGNITLAGISGGTPGYAYHWSNGSTSPSLTGVGAGSYTLTVTDANGCMATGTAVLSLPTNCPVCQSPVVTVSSAVCAPGGSTYTVSYAASVGAIVTASAGVVSNGVISSIPLGVALVVTASNSCGQSSVLTVPAAVCPPVNCTALAGLSVGQAICQNGSSYIARVAAGGGTTLSVLGGSLSNGVVTGTVGTNVTVVATTGCDTRTLIINSPSSCTSVPVCSQPLVSLAGPVCQGSSYSVHYSSSGGVTLVASAGVVSNGQISGIALGVPLSVTVSNGSCTQVVTLAPPTNCPPLCPAPAPVLTITDPVCNTATGTYTIQYTVSAGASVTASAGTINLVLKTITVQQGQSVVVTAVNNCGSSTSTTVLAPNCPVGCTQVAGLSVGQAICSGSTNYLASVTVNAGATINVIGGGSYSNGVVTAPVGSNVTVVATLGCSTQSMVIMSPASCSGPICENPMVSIAGTHCDGDTYSVRYTAPSGVTVLSNGGVINAAQQMISGIPAGTPISITVTNGTCLPQIIPVSSPVSCTVCGSTDGTITVPAVPEGSRNWLVNYTLTTPASVINCYNSLGYIATDAAGNILYVSSTPNFTGVVSGTYYVYATTNPLTTIIGKNINSAWDGLMDYPCHWVAATPYIFTVCPPLCPVPAPVLTVTAPVCNTVTNSYSVRYTISIGTSLSTSVGTVNTANQTIIVPLGVALVVTASNSCGQSSVLTVPAAVCPPVNCTALAGLSVGQAICQNGSSYIARVAAGGGTTLSVLGGSLSNGVVTGTVGTNVTVVATTGCDTRTLIINSPSSCTSVPVCSQPLVSLAGPVCQGSSYSVHYSSSGGVTLVASAGVVSNGQISGIALGVPLSVTVSNGSCTQVVILAAPTNCPSLCPIISVVSTAPTTCTANNGSLTLTGLTAGESYTVCYTKTPNNPFCQTLLANQNGRIVLSGLGVGLYTNITVAQNGCVSNAVSATLSGGLPAPSATCSVTAVCMGQSIILTASGTNIQWNGPGLLASSGSPVTAIPNVTGIVTYTAIQSANGCVSPPSMVTVVVKPTPTFSVTATNPTVCNSADGSMTLIGLTPGQSYTVCYTKNAGVPVCAERLANVNGLITIGGLTAGVYTNITVNELGCLSSARAITLTNPALPNPVVTVAPGSTICLGQAVSLTATGETGAVFTWKGSGLLGTTGSVVTVNPQSTGTMSYTVTQTVAGCGSSSAVTLITVNPVPSAVLISKVDPNSCSNPNGGVTLGGLLSNQLYTVCYRVNGIGSPVCLQLSSNGLGNIVMNSLTAGVYSVTVSNGGCSSQPVSATLVGQTPAQPTVTVTPSATICIGQSVTLTASSSTDGPFTWTGLDLSSINGGTATATPTATGVRSYTVIQTVNGCTSIPAIVPITVMAIPAPNLVTTTAPTTCSGTNGSVTLGGLTANQSYTVCYNNGSGTQCGPFTSAVNGQLVVSGLTSGSYSLTVLSPGGCRNAVPVSATVASSTACSMCTDAPLIVAQPMLICKDSTKTVSMQILDADLVDSFTATACGVGFSNATVTIGVDNQTRQLSITYKAAPGFQGIDQVCVTVTDKCGNFDQVYIPVQVIRCVCGCSGTPPVVVPQPIITTKNTPKEVCVPIVDTPTDVHTATICGGPQHGTAVVTVNNQTHMLCVLYTPNTDYVGVDKVCITICDQTNRCTVIEVPITVIDIPNPPALSVVPLVTNCSSTTSAHMPILDVNVDNTHSVSIIAQPLNGTITATVDQVNHRVLITYTPAPGFTGNDKAVVRVTDSDGLSSGDTDVPLLATPGTCPACLTMELKVLLEGPYNTTTHKMNTVLNQRGLLPGQTPIGQFAVPTPAGQPYNTAPWNYTGTESLTTYDQDIVDWVLVSLRTDELSTTPVFRVAGLLHDDGRITFVNPCFDIPEGSYHVVIEHRNHMGVMSPTKVPVIANKILFDFTTQDSYLITDPPSFGQIPIDGKWMMYGGDGKKDVFSDNFDINFFDSKLWKDESGIFDQYRYGDFNLDADVNFTDSVLWKKNNGRYSKVPH
ncbi:Ig-like domain-containing protein [Larkinella bovis]|uniref:Ig-like domain-containing protein n=1 Tax=Larkinella bovis TaxID=683041 RepID=A0ABW0IA18_9BACT